ncbi:hypothetical protein DERP_003203 [Dermatophagoides pteronyssinus]|uniref:Peptidase C1A papain C-terminal domain-containing protein n=2 Tax=Dermatophagoides pteronyssinus TaxID=6956 RepID=A0ABQ8JIU0_DERPT|nr:hypothetical protein DERP_003203 [Dermatophagoides pteronyssinus]
MATLAIVCYCQLPGTGIIRKLTPNQQKIMDTIDKRTDQITQFLSIANLQPNETFSKLFPSLSKISLSKIKECYDMSVKDEEYNFFDQNLASTLRTYYKNFPENFDVKQFPKRMKNLFDSMMQIANYTIACIADIGEYQLGLTQLSDWDDKEYKILLGEKISNNIDNDYNNRKQGKSSRSGNRSPSLGSLNPLSGNRNRGGGGGSSGNNGGRLRLKRAIEVADECKAKNRDKLPKTFDWRKKGMVTEPKFQSKCGSCWAFVSTSIVESAYLINGLTKNKSFDLSEQELIDCAKKNGKGCNGGTAIDSFNYMLTVDGLTDESSYPYESKDGNCRGTKKNRAAVIDDYCVRGKYVTLNGKKEELSDEDIQYLIKEFGPVYSTINADDLANMKNLKKGVYKNKKCDKKTNHAIVIVGWDEKAWIVKNSWGTGWGDKGFFRMKRGENLCGINTYIIFPLVGLE